MTPSKAGRRWFPALSLLLCLLLLAGCTSTPPDTGPDTEEPTYDLAGWETLAPDDHTDPPAHGGTQAPETAKPATPETLPPLDAETQPPPDFSVDCHHADADDNGVCDLCEGDVLVVLDVYAINDLHGKLADTATGIGVDELTTYLKTQRAADEASILLSTGDMWQGSSESNLTEGRIITDWMNALDFDCMTLGNHEFDWGQAAVMDNRNASEFPFLAINIFYRADNSRPDYCSPSVVVDMGDWEVGIIGAIGDCYSSIAGDKVSDVYFKTGGSLTALVEAEAVRLREMGVDYVIYAIHDGYGSSNNGSVGAVSDGQLSSYYDAVLSGGAVDLVFEGHTHQRYVLRDSRGVYHLQGGGENKGISHAEITLNIANGNSEVSPAYIPSSVYGSCDSDPIVEELLEEYRDEVEVANRVVGYNASFRSSKQLRQLVADLYLEVGLSEWGDEYEIFLGGGFISVRNPWELTRGDVTYGTLQSLFPFDNQLVLCSIKGSDLRSRFVYTSNDNYFNAYSDYGKEHKTDIDPNATYYVIVDTYSSGYAPNRLTEVARYTPGVYARNLLADYIAAGGLQ